MLLFLISPTARLLFNKEQSGFGDGFIETEEKYGMKEWFYFKR